MRSCSTGCGPPALLLLLLAGATQGGGNNGPPAGPAKSWSHHFRDLPPSSSRPLAVVRDGALPKGLLEHLQLNARHFWEANSQQKAGHGKRPTVWLALNTICTKPSRFFIEEAVAALSTYVDVTEWGLPADTVIQAASGGCGRRWTTRASASTVRADPVAAATPLTVPLCCLQTIRTRPWRASTGR